LAYRGLGAGSIQGQVLGRNVEQFRGGLVFKATRLVYHSSLGSSVKKKKKGPGPARGEAWRSPSSFPMILHLLSRESHLLLGKEIQIPWRKDGPLKLSRWFSGFGPVGCQQRSLSLLDQASGFRVNVVTKHLNLKTSRCRLSTF